jgi:hypothetical protein
MNRLLARAALEAGFRHLPFGRYASAAAFEMTLRPQFFSKVARRMDGTYPTGADWGFVTRSKLHSVG